MLERLDKEFFMQDVLTVGQELIGKLLVREFEDGTIKKFRIIETESYNGEEDSACHARFGKTTRSDVLYYEGGHIYVYLCYGIHFLLNIVTGKKEQPEAVLIRGIEGFVGPGKITKELKITKEFNKKDITSTDNIWIEDDGTKLEYICTPRIGIDYASEPYKSIEWRYVVKK